MISNRRQVITEKYSSITTPCKIQCKSSKDKHCVLKCRTKKTGKVAAGTIAAGALVYGARKLNKAVEKERAKQMKGSNTRSAKLFVGPMNKKDERKFKFAKRVN